VMSTQRKRKPITPILRWPALFMYERLRPPGFHAGSSGSEGPGVGEDGAWGVDIPSCAS